MVSVEDETILGSEYRDERQLPNIRRKYHTAHTHRGGHKYVDGIVVQKASATFDSSAAIAIFLDVRSSQEYLRKSCEPAFRPDGLYLLLSPHCPR